MDEKKIVLQSLSDDLKKKKTARVGTQESAVKKNSQGRNPKIRKKEQCQLQAKEQCQQQAKK